MCRLATPEKTPMSASLTVQSPAFAAGRLIPRRYSGDGEDLSPPLSWSSPPPGTRELALIVDDPEAPSAEPWVHWVLYNLAADTRELAEGVHQRERPPFPAGAIQGVNSWGTVGYRGPAPPRGHGVHHYHVAVFALDAPLGLPVGLDKTRLLEAMAGHVMASGELVGTFERPR
jgi:Raf kinase inhibitor-like YbhB/YbcL family protein